MKAKPQNPVIEEAMGPLMESTVTPRVSANRGHGRAIHPVVGLSSKYEDDREQGSVIRVALAVLLTLGVVIAVTIFMTNQ